MTKLKQNRRSSIRHPPGAVARVSLAVTFFAAFSASTHAFGLNTRPDRHESRYSDYGKQFPAVCLITWEKSRVVRDGKGLAGSGTLVAPDWVLTAAHVVDEAAATGGRVTAMFDEQEIEVERIVIHPDYPPWPNDQRAVGWPDIALLKLRRPVATLESTLLYRGNDEAGRTATIVGFGPLGTFATGAPQREEVLAQPVVRRAGTNLIDKIWLEDRCLTQVSPLTDATDLEAGILGGDSGGALLIREEREWFVAGVNKASIGGGAESVHPSYGDNDVFLRVSSYSTWIDATINGGTPTAESSAPTWTRGALLPSFALLVCVILWCVRWRRIRKPTTSPPLA